MEELPDESTEANSSKPQCPCRIGLKFQGDSWHVQKLDLTHKGHKLPSAVTAPSGMDHGRFDGMLAPSLDGWEPPKDLDNIGQ